MFRLALVVFNPFVDFWLSYFQAVFASYSLIFLKLVSEPFHSSQIFRALLHNFPPFRIWSKSARGVVSVLKISGKAYCISSMVHWKILRVPICAWEAWRGLNRQIAVFWIREKWQNGFKTHTMRGDLALGYAQIRTVMQSENYAPISRLFA